MVKYTSLEINSNEATTVYFDECERKDAAGKPSYGPCDILTLILIYTIWFITLPFTFCCSFKIIPQCQRVIVYRLGRILPLKGPGLITVVPCIDKLKRVDMRMRAFKVPPQEIMTVDNGVLKIGADVQYRYVDPILTQTIQDLDHSLRVSGQASLTSIISCNDIAFVKHEKQLLQQRLQSHLNKVVSAWGIEIARFEMEHSTVLKERGGITPSSQNDDDEVDGAEMIMNLIKSVVSPEGNLFSGLSIPHVSPTDVLPNYTSTLSSSTQKVAAPALLTAAELFSIAKGIVDEPLCQQINAVFQFQIQYTDPSTRTWTVDVKNSPGFVIEGPVAGFPDVVFKLEEQTFQKIFYGQLTPRQAYMNSQLTFNGSLATAMKLELLIKRLKAM
eukprot:TCONS_00000127-protein